MKINLNKPFNGLDGKQIENLMLGKILANHLASANKGDAVKMIDWAMKLYNGKELDLDKSDIKTMTEFVEKSEAINNICKAQILDELYKKESKKTT